MKDRKLIELISRISSISKEIMIEEMKYHEAAHKDLSDESLQKIKDRINFLKRKHALFSQAKQMRSLEN